MRTLLHILTTPPDELVQRLIEHQQQQPNLRVEIVDLTAPGEPDYQGMLDRIFAADSVATW